MLKKKIVFGLLFLLIMVGTFVMADIIMFKDSNCKGGLCYVEKVDLSLQESNGDLVLNNYLTISSSLNPSYEIEVQKDDKFGSKIRYIESFTKSKTTTEEIMTYNKKPKQIIGNYYFTDYESYTDYCAKFKNCLKWEEYKYQVLEYDIDGGVVYINTRRIDETTGEVFPTSINSEDANSITLKTKLNDKTSISFNDIIISSGVIWINGDNNQWINYTTFLYNTAPECFYENASGVAIENISVITTPCQLRINHSANLSFDNFSLIFDSGVIGGSGSILWGNYTNINLTNGFVGFSSTIGSAGTGFQHLLSGSVFSCVSGQNLPSQNRYYSPHCGSMNFENMNFNGLVDSYNNFLGNATFINTQWVKTAPAVGGWFSNFDFSRLTVIGDGILGAKAEGDDIYIKSTGWCFVSFGQSWFADFQGGTYDCVSDLSRSVFAGQMINITDGNFINNYDTSGAVATWNNYIKNSLAYNFTNTNTQDLVNVNITCADSQGNVYSNLGNSVDFKVDIAKFSELGNIDFNPITCNITNSSFFPIVDYQYNLTSETCGDYKMYKIPYAITFSPSSDFNLKIS